MAAIAAVKLTTPSRPKVTKTITKERLVAMLANQHHLSKRASQEMFNDLISMITKHLQKGERVKIAGLGILQVRDRPARMGRNPMTGEPVEIKAGRKVAFRTAKKLKLAISPVARRA
jgi:DNA-binding protein HU-beta